MSTWIYKRARVSFIVYALCKKFTCSPNSDNVSRSGKQETIIGNIFEPPESFRNTEHLPPKEILIGIGMETSGFIL